MKGKRFSEEQIIAELKDPKWRENQGAVPTTRDLGGDLLQLEGEERSDDGAEAGLKDWKPRTANSNGCGGRRAR